MKQTLLLISLLFSFFVGFGQCPDGDVVFASQAEVDAFAVNFPGCDAITGNLRISGSNITNLTPLNSILLIQGNFELDNNELLENIEGLNTIFSIGGVIRIRNNPMLQNIDGLSNLSFVEGNLLTIDNNDNLQNINGLQNTIYPTSNNSLGVSIKDNPVLENLIGLQGINGPINSLEINNTGVQNLEGLENITGAPSSIVINNNNNLQTLNGVENITANTIMYDVRGNNSLTDISAMSTINPANIFSLRITDNPMLSVCNNLFICEFVDGFFDENDAINNNALGCNSLQEVQSACGFICPPGDIIFSTQAEIDAFAIDFPNCTNVNDNITISGSDITNLQSLTQVISVNGTLTIEDNPVLTSLTGFNNLESTLQRLQIFNNPLLENLIGLDSYESSGLDIRNNAGLVNLNGISSFAFLNVTLMNNNALTDITALNTVSEINQNSNINISGNDLLSQCAIDIVCNVINTNQGQVVISNNGPDCEEFEDVFIQCTGCPSDFIQLTSQEEVNNFGINFPTCTQANFSISGPDIVDLTPLQNITDTDIVNVTNNPMLTTLEGLNNIENTGEIRIFGNPLLTDVSALSNITDVFSIEIFGNNSLETISGWSSLNNTGVLTIINNESLTSIEGLQNVSVNEILRIENNDSLENLSGLEQVQSLINIDILENASLVDISALSNLNTNLNTLNITLNPLLTNLDGLEGINNVVFSINVSSNNMLENLNALSNITNESVNNSPLGIDITFNDALTDISGLASIDPTTFQSVVVTNNENLSQCSILSFCEGIEMDASEFVFNNNAPGCNTIEEVQAACNPCPILESIILTSQAEVNEYAVQFPDCDIIQGTLRVSGGDIVDLSPLNTVTTVGDLEIVDNPILENLDGLALMSIGKTTPDSEPIFTISGNPSLENIDGLSQLFEIEAKTFEISNNPLITNLDVLNNVSIEIDFVDAILKIDNNASLVTMNGFNELISFSGNLMISNNPLLETLPTNFATSALDTISIINNDSLLNLEGLNELLEADQLMIEGNDALGDLSGLDTLEDLNILEIINNPLLEDLSELNGLSRIGNGISISNNSNLTSLQGLQGLFGFENTGGVLSITDNVNLSDISVLDFFSLFVPYEAIITGNTSLSSCDLNSFCEIIISNGEITIENNGAGCSTVEEVGLNCDPCSIPGLTLSSQAEIDSFPTVYGGCPDGFVNVVISGPDIVDLTPLSSFTFVAGDLRIFNNEQLVTLEGLNNLSSVIILDIQNNPQLSDITAVSNALNNDASIELIIKDNPLLETCSFAAMCNFFETNIIEAVIENNGEQCTTLDQVIENCATSTNLISGTILFDFNNDGCTTDDYATENILVQTTNGVETQISITDGEGNFSLFVDEGVYTTSIISESLPYEFQGTPESIESVFTGLGNEEIVDFCVEAIEVVNDIAITLVPLQEPRPGFDATYVISYSNLGTIAENGTITMNFDEEILFYVDSSLTPSMINATSIEWEYNEILPFETRSFEVSFELFIPPTVEGGEILVSELEITTSIEDTHPENNVFTLAEIVVNSFDPNDKQVLQGERILEEEVGDYLDYVVRFQNTGTADAINVTITDVLSDNLNWGSLRILSSSDDYRVEITNGNEVAFIYENINLPPEEQDEEGSNGYIAFQIRSNDDLVLGDVIENTANIFFDFNAPIITNTVTTTVSEPCPEGDLIFTSQAEINAFSINYPTCTEIDSQLIIEGDDITDLSPLSGITSVIEGVVIRNNTNLVTLAGLAVTQIAGDIQILNNSSLENLQGLEGLTSMEDMLVIRDNAALISLSGLNNLTHTDDLSIINNDNLEDLVGLGSLTSTDGDLSIEDNDSLENLGGLMNYSSGDGLSIVNNNALTSMDGIGAFDILALSIHNNPSMVDILSLNQVENIGEILEIVNNDNLTSLEGLENLNSVGFGFTISGNETLTDITALSELLDPLMHVIITNNPNLSVCDIDVVCSFIDNLEPSQDVLIANNATNCNSVEEVEEQCLLSVEEILLDSEVKLYPNPTARVLNITLPFEIKLQTIDIFSVTGKKVHTTQGVTIDFSSLAKGMYFARITTSKGIITKKIVKK